MPDVGVLIALGVGVATHVPAGDVATHIVLGVHIIGLDLHRQESPAVVTAVPAFAAAPAIGRAECREHGAAGSHRGTPVALCLVVVVVDLEDALSAPLAILRPEVGKVGIQRVTAVADDLLHIGEGLRIACRVVLIHHHLGIEHVGERLAHATALGSIPAHGQHAGGDDVLEFGQQLVVDLVGLHLRSRVGQREVLQVEGHVAVVMPQDIIIVHAKQTGLHLHRTTEAVAGLAFPSSVLDGIVATLDTAVEVAPKGGQRLVAVAFEVEEFMPVLVVGGIGAAYPEVVAHDLSVDGEVVVGRSVPVGPVQGSVGRGEGLVEVLLCGVVFFERLARGIGYLQKFVAAGGEGCGHTTVYETGADCFIYLGIHNVQFSIFNVQL